MKVKFGIFFLLTIFYAAHINRVQASETCTESIPALKDCYVISSASNTNYGKTLSLFSYYSINRVYYASSTFTAGTSDIVWIPIYDLFKGSIISGEFSVISGGNLDIDFIMKHGNTNYLSLPKITRYSFTFSSPYTADFYLGFDNTFSWFTSKQVRLSEVLRTDYGIYASPIFLSFDLSNIPPEATITSAKLKLYVYSQQNTPNLAAYYCNNNYWSETGITYNNAPLEFIEKISSDVTIIDNINEWYEIDVLVDVVKALPSYQLTEVITIDNEGMVEIASRESIYKPSLEIEYKYSSVSCSSSASTIILGENVAISAQTEPVQTEGEILLQYSLDKLKWNNLESVSGGSADCVWTPEMTGQVFLRAIWSDSWKEGSMYSTSSPINSLYIKNTYSTECEVKDSLGFSILDAEVNLYYDNKLVTSDTTDSNGRVIFNKIPEGEYSILVKYLGQKKNIDISLFKNESIKINMIFSYYSITILLVVIVILISIFYLFRVRKARTY